MCDGLGQGFKASSPGWHAVSAALEIDLGIVKPDAESTQITNAVEERSSMHMYNVLRTCSILRQALVSGSALGSYGSMRMCQYWDKFLIY